MDGSRWILLTPQELRISNGNEMGFPLKLKVTCKWNSSRQRKRANKKIIEEIKTTHKWKYVSCPLQWCWFRKMNEWTNISRFAYSLYSHLSFPGASIKDSKHQVLPSDSQGDIVSTVPASKDIWSLHEIMKDEVHERASDHTACAKTGSGLHSSLIFVKLFYELSRLVKESNEGLKNKILKIEITSTQGQ